MKKNKALIIIVFWMVVIQSEVIAEGLYREMVLVGGYSNVDKVTGRHGSIKNAVGIEWFEKFSDEYGDYMTANLQMRIVYDSLEDSRDAWGLEIHNAWIDYKLSLGEYLRIGHFDPAFGLEPVVDTHGTLFQTLMHHNIGFKKDWGLGWRTQKGRWDYSIAAQTGTGMSLQQDDGSFLLTGRVGTPQNREFRYGLSVLHGRVLEPIDSWTIPVPRRKSDDAVIKKRVGVDVQYDTGPILWSSEFAVGQTDGDTAAGAILQADYRVPDNQKLTLQTQGIYWSDDWGNKDERDITIGMGFSYVLTSTLTLRAGYFHDIYSSGPEKERQVVVQLYYLGR